MLVIQPRSQRGSIYTVFILIESMYCLINGMCLTVCYTHSLLERTKQSF